MRHKGSIAQSTMPTADARCFISSGKSALLGFNVLEKAERRMIFSTGGSDNFAVVDAFSVRVVFLTFSGVLDELFSRLLDCDIFAGTAVRIRRVLHFPHTNRKRRRHSSRLRRRVFCLIIRDPTLGRFPLLALWCTPTWPFWDCGKRTCGIDRGSWIRHGLLSATCHVEEAQLQIGGSGNSIYRAVFVLLYGALDEHPEEYYSGANGGFSHKLLFVGYVLYVALTRSSCRIPR